jgi:hypothetical protein
MRYTLFWGVQDAEIHLDLLRMMLENAKTDSVLRLGFQICWCYITHTTRVIFFELHRQQILFRTYLCTRMVKANDKRGVQIHTSRMYACNPKNERRRARFEVFIKVTGSPRSSGTLHEGLCSRFLFFRFYPVVLIRLFRLETF